MKTKKKSTKQKTIVTLLLITLIGLMMGFLVGWINSYFRTANSSTADDYAHFNESAELHQTVFFGDSITEFYTTDDFYGDFTKETGQLVYNRGISGNKTNDLLARLDDNVLSIIPKNLVLLIGTNDLIKGYSVERIAENIQTIIQRSQAAGVENIILIAVYPVNHFRNLFGMFMVNIRSNNKINRLNEQLKIVAAEENIIFLDFTDELKDQHGRMKKEYTFDGLHINRDAYIIVTRHIKPYLLP